ncbi:hypothetical protein AAKU55_000227 [Oxalobacteraceae bacterium GrIS 1.11]
MSAWDAQRERALARADNTTWHEGMDMRNWYPLCISGEPARIYWRHLGERRFTDSFFEQTLSRQPPGQRLTCQTPAAALDQFDDGLRPGALIFHISRCGSTLLTQLLAALPQCVVMSEPPVIDALLRLHHAGPGRQDAPVLLRKLVLALGQRRFAEEEKFFIKFDSWHIHNLPLIRLAFPATPCIFLYREPEAVLASHRRQRGPQMVPGMLEPALLPPPQAIHAADLDGYAGAILRGFFAAATVGARRGQFKLINYSQLPAVPDLLRWLGIACSDSEQQALLSRARFHSKASGTPFRGDPAPAPSAGLGRDAAGIQALYLELEQLRLAQAPLAGC